MTIQSNIQPGTYDEISLYYLIGEAVCMIQHLEGVLSVSITLKKYVKYPSRITKEEADGFLKKNYSLTLGQAIRLAIKNSIYSDVLHSDLKAFQEERNWLIHKLLHHNLDDIYVNSTRDNLFHRIKTISNQAKILREKVEVDLIEFSELTGKDMSRVRAYIKQYSYEV